MRDLETAFGESIKFGIRPPYLEGAVWKGENVHLQLCKFDNTNEVTSSHNKISLQFELMNATSKSILEDF